MPLENNPGAPFDGDHEQRMYDRLAADLQARLANDSRLHILLGNFQCERQFDALYIGPGGVCIVELKSESGQLHAPQNEEWYVEDREVKAAGTLNPYKQVHSCKFKLIDRLTARWKKAFGDAPSPRWHYINGRVVFNDPIVFENRLDDSVGTWFRIKGLGEVGGNLAGLRIKTFDLNEEQIRFIADAVLNRETGKAVVPRILHLNDSEFSRSMRALLDQQGDASIALGLVKSFREQISQGRNPLADVPFDASPDIEGLRIHKLTKNYRLMVIHHHGTNYLVKVCTEDEVAAWVGENRGLVYTVDSVTGKIQPTRKNIPVSESVLDVQQTKENIPFLSRVETELIDAGVPLEALSSAQSVDEDTSGEDRQRALSGIDDPELLEMTQDVIELLRQGKREQAIARIKLHSDQAVPLAEAPDLQEEAIDDVGNSETLVDWKNLPAHELEQLIKDVPEDKWMTFLHPGQKEVVTKNFPKPVVLTGVSGSGKTAVLMHRARRMAVEHPQDRVLVLALNKSLATMIGWNLDSLCSPEERARIHVRSFHDYLRDLLSEMEARKFLTEMAGYTGQEEIMRPKLEGVTDEGLASFFQAKDESDLMELFDDFLSGLKGDNWDVLEDLSKYLTGQVPRLDVAQYLFEEMELLRSAFPAFEDYSGYLREFKRQGRAIQFQAKHRNQVVRLLRLWEAFQIEQWFLDQMGLTQAAFFAIEDVGRIGERFRYRAVLVDEFQDFSNLDLRIIARIPKHVENGLFLTGDYAQKLYAKQLNLREAGLGDRSRAKILKNYRNTRQILHAADTLLHAYPSQQGADDEEGNGILPPEYAVVEGPKPTAYRSANPVVSAWRDVMDAVEDGVPSQAICIISANTARYPLDEIIEACPEGLKATELSGWREQGSRSVVVSDILTVKGFEFRNVLVLGLENDVFPEKGRMPDEFWRDAQRLYVAITRGRLEVRFYYTETPSPFLKAMGDTVAYRQTAEVEPPKARVPAQVEVQAEVTPQTIPEEVPEPPASGTGETFSDGSWFHSSIVNARKVVVFRRRPNQIELASVLGTTQAQISNWLRDGHNLQLIPTSPLEWHLVEFLAGKLDVIVEYHEKGKGRVAEAPTHRPPPPVPPAPPAVPAVPAPVPPQGGGEAGAIQLGEVTLGTETGKFDDIVSLFGGEDEESSEPVAVKVTKYPLTGPAGLSLTIHVKRAADGRGQVTCGENHTTDPTWQRLVNRLRQSIYRVPGEKDSYFLDLQQARFKPDGGGWSGRYKPTFGSLDEGAKFSVRDCLIGHGADVVATREDAFGEDNQRRTYPCVCFGSESEIVPAVAYVVTTVLPLLHGVTHS
jgi:superfamily I DNA/RNA helicase